MARLIPTLAYKELPKENFVETASCVGGVMEKRFAAWNKGYGTLHSAKCYDSVGFVNVVFETIYNLLLFRRKIFFRAFSNMLPLIAAISENFVEVDAN